MAVFLHTGWGKSVFSKDIVGIFDIETSTTSKATREFLRNAQDKGEIIDNPGDIPKSFIISENKERKSVILSVLSTATLNDRQKRKI